MGPNGAYLSPRDPHRGMQPARGRDLSSRWTVHVACQLSFSMVPAPQVPRRHLGCRPQVPRRHLRCRPQVPRRHLRCRRGTSGPRAAPQVPPRLRRRGDCYRDTLEVRSRCESPSHLAPPRHPRPAPQVPPRQPGAAPGCRARHRVRTRGPARLPGRHLGCRRTIPYLRHHIGDAAS